MSLDSQSAATQGRADNALRGGAIGAFGLTFMVVAAAAPLTAMASNISLSLAFGVGAGTVGLLVAVAILLTVFASAFVALSRHVTNAGAYYAYIGHGLGGSVGAGAAFIATLAYNLAVGAMATAAGYFADLTVLSYFGFDLPWWAYGLVALAIVAVLSRRGVDIYQWVTTGISLLQFVVLLVLGLSILVQRPGGWSLDPFGAAILDGNIALSLVFCTLCYAGFEATAIYGEEARAARRSIRVATYSSIALMLVIFVFSTWSIVSAFPDVQAEASADPGSLVFRVADVYLGSWSGGMLMAMATISFLAAAIAFHNMAARYHFSLARAGMLPRTLYRVHSRYGTPHRCSAAQIGVTIVVMLPFVLVGADPILTYFPPVAGIIAVSLVTLMLGCCLSILVAGRRGLMPDEGRWVTVVAPALAGAGMAAILLIIFLNYQEVSGSTEPIIGIMPLIPLAVAVYGVVAFRRAGYPRIDVGDVG
jgi:amino acid transporter